MTKHYVNAALHSLSRSPAHAVISLLGLAVAFASLLLIGAYVKTELTHDTWVPGYQNVYRLAKSASFNGQHLVSHSGGPAEALWLKNDLPEVQAIARLLPRTQSLRAGDVEIFNTVVWADPEIFDVLPMPLMAGSASSALRDADALVISRELARRLLGTSQVLGRSIEVDGHPMRITAVLDEVPGPSHLAIDVLASGNSTHSGLAVQGGGRFDFDSVYTYLRITPGAMQAARDALPALIDRHTSAADLRGILPPARMSSVFAYELQPLARIHMIPQKDLVVPYTTDMLRPSGDMNLVLALAAIGALIVLVATANFVNIMSTRAVQRGVEVGMRKVIGASRLQLMQQFIGESIALTAAGALVGILAGVLCLRGFGAYLNRALHPSFLIDPLLVTGLLLAVLVVGALGGIYPGLVMSSFRPAQILKGGSMRAARSGAARQASVVFQFALLIALAVAVMVIGRQVAFLVKDNFHVNTDQLLYVHAPCTDSLRDRIGALRGTLGVACAAESMLGMEGSPPVPASLPDGTPFRYNVVGVGPGALELLGLKPLAGRFVSNSPAEGFALQGGPSALSGVVINQAALRGMRFRTPEEAIGQPMPGSMGAAPPIIGVVDDFPLRSLRQAIAPVMFRPVGRPGLTLVKLRATHIPQSLREIEQIWKSSGNAGSFKAQFHDQYVRRLYEDIARMRQLCATFAAIAAFIAALGIYGLSALAVEQGAVGVGVRKTFGASRSHILALLLWKFAMPVVVASLLAWPLSYWAMRRWLEGFAYRIELTPWIFLAASAAAMVVALVTVTGHAVQLSRLRPVVALRHR